MDGSVVTGLTLAFRTTSCTQSKALAIQLQATNKKQQLEKLFHINEG
jgi:hypothetical protein